MCLLSCFSIVYTTDTSRPFVDSLPPAVKQDILWYFDYEDNSFYKWEGQGPDDLNASGGIFITDTNNSSYGIESSVSFSGQKSAFATIQNASTPTQKKAVRFMRWTYKPWYQDGDYFPDAAFYSTFSWMEHVYDPAKDSNNDPEGDGGWWNVFQFKSDNNAGSMPVMELDMYTKDGAMYFGLSIKDYSNIELSEYKTEG